MKAGWQSKNLAEVLLKTETVNPLLKPEVEFDYIDVSSVSNQTFQIEETQQLKGKDAPSRARKLVKTDDILFATIRPTLQRIAIVPAELNNQVCSTGYFVLRPNQNIHFKYLYFYLFSDFFMGQMEVLQKGASYPAVTDNEVKSQNINFPSIQEQQRIVAILDEAFEQIAIARANTEKNLQNARALFESYLHSIDAEEQEFGNFVSIKTGKLDANAAVEGGAYPFFTCSRDVYRIDKFAFDCEAILLAGNNASGDFNVKHYIGKFNAYQRTYVITVNNESDASYRYLYFQLLAKLKDFKKQSVGSNTKFLKIGMIQGMKIPMPSFAEQQAIVIKLDGLLAETQHLESIYQRKLTALDALKKSLLHKAFAGEL